MSQDLRQEHMARHKGTSFSDQLSDPPDTQVVSESNDDDIVLATYPPRSSTFVYVLTTAFTSTIRSTLRTSRKPTKRFESQNAQNITAAELKEQRRKDKEAKANRTGTGRMKKAEALAQTSQLLDGIELPFHSSQ